MEAVPHVKTSLSFKKANVFHKKKHQSLLTWTAESRMKMEHARHAENITNSLMVNVHQLERIQDVVFGVKTKPVIAVIILTSIIWTTTASVSKRMPTVHNTIHKLVNVLNVMKDILYLKENALLKALLKQKNEVTINY